MQHLSTTKATSLLAPLFTRSTGTSKKHDHISQFKSITKFGKSKTQLHDSCTKKRKKNEEDSGRILTWASNMVKNRTKYAARSLSRMRMIHAEEWRERERERELGFDERCEGMRWWWKRWRLDAEEMAWKWRANWKRNGLWYRALCEREALCLYRSRSVVTCTIVSGDNNASQELGTDTTGFGPGSPLICCYSSSFFCSLF